MLPMPTPSSAVPVPPRTRIMFVDDQPVIISTMKILLRSKHQDWEMEFVESGAEALARMTFWHPQVVVSDLTMPGMDGLSLLDTVHQLYPAILNIVLSGHPAPDEADPTRSGRIQFLRKPFKLAQLEDLVGQFMKVQP